MAENEKRKGFVRAAYAPDGPAAHAMTKELEAHGIDAFRQGGVKDIYKIGGDICGEEIMVSPEDLPRARDILGQFSDSGALIEQKPASAKKSLLSLLAAAVLFVILLLLRGWFF